jgi:hypothetical protein
MNAATLRECLRKTGTGEDKLRLCDEFMGREGEKADAPAEELVEHLKIVQAPEGTVAKAAAITDGTPWESFIGPPPESPAAGETAQLKKVLMEVFQPERARAEEEEEKRHREAMKKKSALANESNWEPHETEAGGKGWKNKVTGDVVGSSEKPTAEEAKALAARQSGQVAKKFEDKVGAEAEGGPGTPALPSGDDKKKSATQEAAHTEEQKKATDLRHTGPGNDPKGPNQPSGHKPHGGR